MPCRGAPGERGLSSVRHPSGTQGRSGVGWQSPSGLVGKLCPSSRTHPLLQKRPLPLMSGEEPPDPGLPGAL